MQVKLEAKHATPLPEADGGLVVLPCCTCCAGLCLLRRRRQEEVVASFADSRPTTAPPPARPWEGAAYSYSSRSEQVRTEHPDT